MAAVRFNRKTIGRNKQVLRYPLKMFTAGTDYLQIDMMTYAPVGTKKTSEDRARYVRNPDQGFRRNTNKEPLGTILLPIPGGIQDRNSVNYADDSMNSLVGAGTGAIETLMREGGAGLAAFLTTGKFDTDEAGKRLEGIFNNALKDSGLSGENLVQMITKSLTGRALSIFGGNVTLQGLLARSEGQVFNPNMELLFSGPSLRNFGFAFKMTPRSADEGEEIKQIIRFFKRGMAAKAGNTGLFLNTPNVFELRYRQGNEEHKFLHKFKQCFLTDVSVNYTGEGVYATYDNGTPVSMIMNLSFKELAPIYDIDYDSDMQSDPNFIGPPGPDTPMTQRNTGFGGVGY
jgi:hypothetical protein